MCIYKSLHMEIMFRALQFFWDTCSWLSRAHLPPRYHFLNHTSTYTEAKESSQGDRRKNKATARHSYARSAAPFSTRDVKNYSTHLLNFLINVQKLAWEKWVNLKVKSSCCGKEMIFVIFLMVRSNTRYYLPQDIVLSLVKSTRHSIVKSDSSAS